MSPGLNAVRIKQSKTQEMKLVKLVRDDGSVSYVNPDYIIRMDDKTAEFNGPYCEVTIQGGMTYTFYDHRTAEQIIQAIKNAETL